MANKTRNLSFGWGTFAKVQRDQEWKIETPAGVVWLSWRRDQHAKDGYPEALIVDVIPDVNYQDHEVETRVLLPGGKRAKKVRQGHGFGGPRVVVKYKRKGA